MACGILLASATIPIYITVASNTSLLQPTLIHLSRGALIGATMYLFLAWINAKIARRIIRADSKRAEKNLHGQIGV